MIGLLAKQRRIIICVSLVLAADARRVAEEQPSPIPCARCTRPKSVSYEEFLRDSRRHHRPQGFHEPPERKRHISSSGNPYLQSGSGNGKSHIGGLTKSQKAPNNQAAMRGSSETFWGTCLYCQTRRTEPDRRIPGQPLSRQESPKH